MKLTLRIALIIALGVGAGSGARLATRSATPGPEERGLSSSAPETSPEPERDSPAAEARLPSLEEWLATIALPSPFKMTGVVEGRVLDAWQAPVEGATLRLEPLLDPLLHAETLIDELSVLRARSRGTVETQSDENGAFVFTGLPDAGRVRVTWVDGSSSGGGREHFVLGEVGTRVAFFGANPELLRSHFHLENPRFLDLAARVGEAPIDRLNAMPGPPEGGLTSGSSPRELMRWDSTSWREQRPKIQVSGAVRAFAHGSLASETVPVSDSDLALEVNLVPCTSLHVLWRVDGGLRAQLVDAEGEPVHCARVGERLESIGLEPGDYVLRAMQENTEVDTWSIAVEPGFNARVIERPFDPIAANTSIDIVTSRGAPARFQRGLSPFGGVTLRFHLDRSTQNAANGSISSGLFSCHSEGARHWFVLDEFLQREVEATPDATVELTATDALGRSGTIRFPARDLRGHHTLVLADRPREVEVVIDGYVGSGYEGKIQLDVRAPGERFGFISSSFGDRTIPDYTGRWFVGGFEEDVVEVIASVSEGDQRGLEYFRTTFDTQGPDSIVLVPLPRWIDISVRVPPSLRGKRVQLSKEGSGTVQSKEVDTARDDLVVVFTGVPPGSYQLRCRGHEQSISAQGGEIFDFRLTEYRALRVSKVRVEGFDLLPDDIIRSVDGVPVATEFPYEFLKERAEETAGETLLLAVDRGGQLFDVEIPGEHFLGRPKIWVSGVEPKE